MSKRCTPTHYTWLKRFRLVGSSMIKSQTFKATMHPAHPLSRSVGTTSPVFSGGSTPLAPITSMVTFMFRLGSWKIPIKSATSPGWGSSPRNDAYRCQAPTCLTIRPPASTPILRCATPVIPPPSSDQQEPTGASKGPVVPWRKTVFSIHRPAA